MRAFGYWHLPLLLGIIAVAAAEKEAVAQPFSSLTWHQAAILAGGVAVYLVGEVGFRRALGIGGLRWRAMAALLAPAAIPVGVALSPFAETAVLVALLVAVLLAEAAQSRAGS